MSLTSRSVSSFPKQPLPDRYSPPTRVDDHHARTAYLAQSVGSLVWRHWNMEGAPVSSPSEGGLPGRPCELLERFLAVSDAGPARATAERYLEELAES